MNPTAADTSQLEVILIIHLFANWYVISAVTVLINVMQPAGAPVTVVQCSSRILCVTLTKPQLCDICAPVFSKKCGKDFGMLQEHQLA